MEENRDNDLKTATVIRVSQVGIVINLFLALFKLLAGILGHSGAMVADAVHSASDILGSYIVILGARISGKQADEAHPYGHERLECIAAFALAGILVLVGGGIGYTGLLKILSRTQSSLEMPGAIALVAAVLSIVVKEALFWYTKGTAKHLNSVSLLAEAWHHRSDAMSSIGSFAGILGARMGLLILDPIASIVICLFIFKVAFDIIKESFDKLVDKSCDPETVCEIRKLITETKGVLGVDDLKTRQFGSKIYVDVEIVTDGGQLLSEAHKIAHAVHDAIEESFRNVKHVSVHINPAEK